MNSQKQKTIRASISSMNEEDQCECLKFKEHIDAKARAKQAAIKFKKIKNPMHQNSVPSKQTYKAS